MRVTLASFDSGAAVATLPSDSVAASKETSSEHKMRFMELLLRLADPIKQRPRVAEPFVESDAPEPRFAQRHQRALLNPSAEVSGLWVPHDLAGRRPPLDSER